MPVNDTLAKLREIARIGEKMCFSSPIEMAQHLVALAEQIETHAFRNIGSNEPSSVLTARRHVEFACSLRLIEFHDPSGFLPYIPIKFDRKAFDEKVELEIWAYLEREGVNEKQLRKAMRGLPVTDATSIWRRLDKRSISHEAFRKCLHILSQVSPKLRANRRKTYYIEPTV